MTPGGYSFGPAELRQAALAQSGQRSPLVSQYVQRSFTAMAATCWASFRWRWVVVAVDLLDLDVTWGPPRSRR
jgi:hypothetical protein